MPNLSNIILFRATAIILAFGMLFARLGELPLRDPDEGRNAEIAREMMLSNSWLTPTFNGVTRLDKPAAYFKVVSFSYKLFGVSEFSARLPSAIAALAILLMVYAFARRHYDEFTAAFAVLVLTTAPLFFAFGREVILDMMFTCFVCGAIFSGFCAEQSAIRRSTWYLFGAASSALATLWKGPVGFLVPTIVLGLFNLIQRNYGWWRRFFAPANVTLFFLICLPWVAGMAIYHPDFLRYGLIEESLHRYVTTGFHRPGPFYLYGIVMAVGVFGWSVLAAVALAPAWKNRGRWQPADRFLFVWTVTVLVFFSISRSKLPHYVLSAVVSISILIARVVVLAFDNPGGLAARIVQRSVVILAAISALVSVIAIAFAIWPEQLVTALRIHGREFQYLNGCFPSIALLFAIVALIAAAGAKMQNVKIGVVAFGAIAPLLLTLGFSAIQQNSMATSSRELAAEIASKAGNREIVCVNVLPMGLPFYLRKPVTLVTADGSEVQSNYALYSIRHNGRWPEQLIRISDTNSWTRTEGRFFVFRSSSKPAVKSMIARCSVSGKNVYVIPNH